MPDELINMVVAVNGVWVFIVESSEDQGGAVVRNPYEFRGLSREPGVYRLTARRFYDRFHVVSYERCRVTPSGEVVAVPQPTTELQR